MILGGVNVKQIKFCGQHNNYAGSDTVWPTVKFSFLFGNKAVRCVLDSGYYQVKNLVFPRVLHLQPCQYFIIDRQIIW